MDIRKIRRIIVSTKGNKNKKTIMKTAKTTTAKMLQRYLTENHGNWNFSNAELENAIDLAVRRGATGRGIIKEAENFLYY